MLQREVMDGTWRRGFCATTSRCGQEGEGEEKRTRVSMEHRLGGYFNLSLCDLSRQYGSNGSNRPKPKQAEFATWGKEIPNISPSFWA